MAGKNDVFSLWLRGRWMAAVVDELLRRVVALLGTPVDCPRDATQPSSVTTRHGMVSLDE